MAEWMKRTHSYNQKKTDDGIETTGSLSWWNDSPATSLQIGSDFQPIPGGPVLKVSSIDIQSEDTGKTLYGKPITLWHVTVNGDTNVAASSAALHYTFSISKDDNGIELVTGTMLAVNDGDNPIFSISLIMHHRQQEKKFPRRMNLSGGLTNT